jgi:hypothetical protein
MIDTDAQQVLDCQFHELEPLNAGMAPAKMAAAGSTTSISTTAIFCLAAPVTER